MSLCSADSHSYFFELAKRFGLELHSAAESNSEWGVWNGEQVVFEKGHDPTQFLMRLLEHYGPTAMTALHEAQTGVFAKYNELFECVARLNSYQTLPELLTDGRLLQLTQLTLAEFLRTRGVSAPAIDEIVAPLVRRSFALPPQGINAFAAIGATLLDNSPMHSIKGGNVQLVQALLRSPGINVVAGKRVSSISRNKSTGIYTIIAKQGKDKKATVQQQFDAVSTSSFVLLTFLLLTHCLTVIALPAYMLKKIKIDFDLPHSLSQSRLSVELYEVYVAGELNDKCAPPSGLCD